MTVKPKVGDPVHFDGKEGVITALVNQDGVVDDPEDAIAVTIRWADGTFSALLISDMEYTPYN